jgi:type II secretory ATPase GspE/PulE/Tfp pilus assembly ATPase PilB-like protein/ActR/RegA family two-component response regulator
MTRLRPDEWLLPVLEPLLADAIEELRTVSGSVWDAVVERGLLTDDDIVSTLSRRFRMPIADLTLATREARDAVAEAVARKHQVVPLAITESTIELATSSPNDFDAEQAIGFATGKAVRLQVASPGAIAQRLDEMYAPEVAIDRMIEAMGASGNLEMLSDRDQAGDFDLSEEKASARPIIRLVDLIISDGIAQRASDIHLEIQEGALQVNYRIDGVLRPSTVLPRAMGIPVVSRIKIMSGLDIADRLRPQDGRARVSINGKRIDLRVSTLPASTGEKVVIRILDTTATVLSLDALGMAATELDRISNLINLREGLVLVTGPTGSGKTTTLYSALKSIQARGVNIVTVEDPVEYRLNGIVQVQVNEKAGLTFAAALRSILRQDPDVVLVGEIRDRETAGIAIQASLTGHLVLSTLHTIDAPSSIARLLDIGIEGYKIGAALKGVVAQRLVRRLCTACKEAVDGEIPAKVATWLPATASLFKAVGCPECGGTGYRGRLALMEVLVSTAELERRISTGEATDRIGAAARQGGMRTLWESGIDHLTDGLTDVEELLRVVEVPQQRPTATTSTGSSASRASALTPAPVPTQRSGMGSGRQRAIDDVRGKGGIFSGDAFELVEPISMAGKAASPRIVVGEGDPDLRAFFRDTLADEGFTVVDAQDGIEALEEIDNNSPELVIIDASLAKLDAIGVMARLKSRLQTSNLRVIVCGTGGWEEEAHMLEAGAVDYVAKPLQARVLAARTKNAIRRLQPS